ncbi:MAG: CBS domain-containing protein [Candidatus Sungbacteria bacterium]|nr:CBS domain-containing protein [Candidatus Sungbacteria bacterium]
MLSVTDIMTKEVISIAPNAPISDAAKILAEHRFDGVPVIDASNVLVGILTEYDMVSSAAIHLPTLQTVLQNLKVFQKDKSQFQKEVQEISSLKVEDVMNKDPLTLAENATYEEAVKAFKDHHRVNPIPVIDTKKHVIGVVSRYDVLKAFEEFK